MYKLKALWQLARAQSWIVVMCNLRTDDALMDMTIDELRRSRNVITDLINEYEAKQAEAKLAEANRRSDALHNRTNQKT